MGAVMVRYPVVQAVEKSLGVRAMAARTPNRHWWSGREYQGDRENYGQGTRQNRPVTSGEGAPAWVGGHAPRARSGRSEKVQATVYQKHRTLLKS